MGRVEQLREVGSYLAKVSLRFLFRRARRYGRVAVRFGDPLELDAWLRRHPGLLERPRPERQAALAELGAALMARIGAAMPVTPVPLACAALLREPGERIARARWEERLADLRLVLRGAGAPAGPELSSAELLDRALVMLTLRRIVSPDADGFRVDRSQEPVLRYYANSIAHFLDPFEPPA
jgi:glycerol-3-phosphate O-acyltransferase